MTYNEYKANEGKVLLNLNNFTYGNTILSKHDLSSRLIELDKSVAEKYANKYSKQMEEYYNKQEKVKSNEQIMILDENGIYSENTEENNIDSITTTLVAEILTKYNTSKNITYIKHE